MGRWRQPKAPAPHREFYGAPCGVKRFIQTCLSFTSIVAVFRDTLKRFPVRFAIDEASCFAVTLHPAAGFGVIGLASAFDRTLPITVAGIFRHSITPFPAQDWGAEPIISGDPMELSIFR